MHDSEVIVKGSLFLFNYTDMKYLARRQSTVWKRVVQ